MPTLRAWLILWAIALAGCETTTRTPSQPVAPFDNPVSVNALTSPIEERESVPNDVWTVLRDGFALNHQTHEPTVARAVDLYLARAPTLDIEVQAKRYLAYVVDEVRRRQLPMELALVPIIESTLNPYAHSRSGAAGLWQLIPPTAKHFGVTMDWWYDGRRDPVDSTTAALDYLTYLHEEFGDWLLAIAAYNGGEGRVRRALSNSPNADFFDLNLPVETKRYVPRLLALAHLIAENDALALPPVDPEPAFFSASLDSQVDLAVLASIGSFSLDEMFRFNPGLNRTATPPDGPYRLLVPETYRGTFESALSQYPKEHVQWKHHVVKRGESLDKIARQYRTSVATLRETNGLTGNTIHPSQSLVIAVAVIQASALPANPMLATPRPKTTHRVTYTVRRGDSLARIADRFNVSISAIADWNNVDPSDVLKPGRRLVLHVPARRGVS